MLSKTKDQSSLLFYLGIGGQGSDRSVGLNFDSQSDNNNVSDDAAPLHMTAKHSIEEYQKTPSSDEPSAR
jgi:hypothetical protein